MARVEWSRLSGDEVEESIAILLCRANPRTIRIRPSRGDGGIDLLLPEAGGAHRVFQVKKFALNLKSSEKRQIEKSYKRLLKYTTQQDLMISSWHLVTPLDLTKENYFDWLSGVTSDSEFPIEWLGLNFVDGLAAQFPEVIDYYLRDGKDRLARAVEQLAAVMQMQSLENQESEPLQAGSVVQGLHALHAQLNTYDPHYRYDLHVTSTELDHSTLRRDSLVCVAEMSDGNSFVAVAIYSRFDEAVSARPIPLSLTVTAAPGSQLESDIRNFHTYGSELSIPAENAHVEFDLPGGLGFSSKGSIRLSPSPNPGKLGALKLVISNGEGEKLAAATIALKGGVIGPSREGGELHGEESGGTFSTILRHSFSGTTSTLLISTLDFTGKRLEEVADGANLLSEFRPPNVLRIINPYDGKTLGEFPITALGNPRAVLADKVIKALILCQSVVGQSIPMPRLEGTPADQVSSWLAAGRLLRGEVIEFSWNEITIPATPDEAENILANLPGSLVLHSPLSIKVGESSYELGVQQFWTPAAQLGEPASADAPTELRVVPSGDAIGKLRLVNGDLDDHEVST